MATVCDDGTPNLSPKGTTAVYDEDHLIFADMKSPGTVRNLKRNPTIEIRADYAERFRNRIDAGRPSR